MRQVSYNKYLKYKNKYNILKAAYVKKYMSIL